MVQKKGTSKKRRTFAADKHNSKTRTDTANKVNPFDLHVNRLKHDVIGKRRNYEKGGQPLKSRARGIEKRKRTLLKEFNSVFKQNTFVDHRLGENDPTLTSDEKLMQRLIAERTKMRPGKESRYNLNDEEDLTHYGQSLSKFEELNQKPVIDDYDDEDDKGRLNSEHFFGGFNSSNEQNKPLSKKEWIEHMIKTTKLDKYERQRENEKVFDMTQTLDEQWKALSTLMGIKERKSKETKETADDYDKLVNSLRFEAKSTGAPVKTIEEKEKETAERLKTLQVEEEQRMGQPPLKSILSKKKTQSHIFVEELDESYYIMDGSKKRVTFDGDEDNEAVKAETISTAETEENTENGDDSVVMDDQDNDEEEDETTNGDLISEFQEIPSEFEKLQSRLAEDKNALISIWKRIHDKRLPPIPKSILSNYFDVLLDYYESMTSNKIVLNQIGKHLLHLVQIVNNDQMKTNIINRLKQYHESLNEQIENDEFCQIDLSFILFLKLIAHLYPTSDYIHAITTPAITLIVQALSHSSLKSLSECRHALLLIELVKQWISKSHRYVPEVIVLLLKLIQLGCPVDKSQYLISLPSKQVEDNELLVVNKDCDLSTSTKVTFFHCEDLDNSSNADRALILQTCLSHLNDFLEIYQSLSAIVEIADLFKKSLTIIADTSKCNQISSQCRQLLTFIETIQINCLTDRKHLEQGKEQKKMLQLFEPRFGPVYEGKKNSRLPKQHAESLHLRQKYKREFKSAKRALQLDAQFIAREELKQQMEKDAQRKRKVKDIQEQLSMQEGEYRKLQKTK